MDLRIFDRMESEVRGYIRSFPVIFSQARGSTLIDEEGTEYIDFFSGAGTLNYGHNNPVLKEKLLEYVQSDGVVHGLDMATSAKKRFLETVDSVLLKPRNWQYTLQFTGPTGTNAVEAALKIDRTPREKTLESLRHAGRPIYGPTEAQHRQRQAAVETDIAELQRQFSFVILDPTSQLCSDQGCLVASEGRSRYRDKHHLTDAGAVLARSFLEPIFEKSPAR